MPFVNIKIVKEVLSDPAKQKDQISERVTAAVSEVVGVPKDAVWVVFEDVGEADWFVGATSVEDMRREQPS